MKGGYDQDTWYAGMTFSKKKNLKVSKKKKNIQKRNKPSWIKTDMKIPRHS